jgi:nitric oxide reductase NorD protein
VGAEVDAGNRFVLLASALSGRPVAVADGDPGMPAWTDGRTVFIDLHADHRTQLECIAVQASLLSAGSLEPGVLDRLARRPAATRRYLSLEGNRALTALSDLLPAAVCPPTDPTTAQRTESPQSSLRLALGSEEVPEPPVVFGVIRPRLVGRARDETKTRSGSVHESPREKHALLRELDDDIGEVPTIDVLSSPVGGGGPIGRLLKRLLGDARSSGTGAPGADAPTRVTRSGHRVSRMGSPTTIGMTLSEEGSLGAVRGAVYPEWDLHRLSYRAQWCTVVELDPGQGGGSPIPPRDVRSLRRALARIGTELERHRRQTQGEELDLDAAVESYVDVRAGSFSDDAIYVESQRSRRDLSVLVLLDISGSAGEPSPSGGTVHDHQLAVATDLTVALHEVGDRVALYGFRSQGRTAVHVFPVKRFDDGLSTLTDVRLGGLEPGGFTRLGAAIRHSTRTLEREGGTARRLLVVLSDGFAYDHGYEGAYGEADARRALSEARHRGIGCLCLSIASSTDTEALRRVFGLAAYAALGTADHMAGALAPLFRAALGTAEFQRRRSQRVTRSTERLSMERSSTA